MSDIPITVSLTWLPKRELNKDKADMPTWMEKSKSSQPCIKNYRKTRSAKSGKNSIPQEKSHQWLILYSMVRPRNRYVSNMIQTFQVMFRNKHTHAHTHTCARAHTRVYTHTHTLTHRLITIIKGKCEHGLERELRHPSEVQETVKGKKK